MNGYCGCHRCTNERQEGMSLADKMPEIRMILCETCGNKRCPHATDHRLACTNSNEPGQPGSVYAIVAALLLAGCATMQPQEQPIFRSTPPAPPVQVIVKEPCVDPAKLKPVPPSKMVGAPDWAAAAAGMGSDAVTFRLLALEYYDLLKPCTIVKKDAQ